MLGKILDTLKKQVQLTQYKYSSQIDIQVYEIFVNSDHSIQIFSEQIANMILQGETIQLNNQGQAVCGKSLKSKDLGFKCLDCQMDSTCIICQECYENGDHRGHRVIPQYGCAGMCDCGDSEAWNPKGNCKHHQGLNNQKIEQFFSPEFQQRFIQVIKSVFYYFFQIQESTFKSDTMIGSKAITHYFEAIMHTFQLLKFQKNSGIDLLIQKLLTSPMDYYLDHTCTCYKDMEFNQQEKPCQCSILENIFRFNLSIESKSIKKISDMCLALFSFYEFKQKLIVSYCKMFYFFFSEDDQKPSSIIDLNVQLFTSDQLSKHAIQSEYYENIISFFRQCFVNIIEQEEEEEQQRYQFEITWQVIMHLKYVTMKEISTQELINKPQLIEKLIDIMYEISYEPKYKPISQHIANDQMNENDIQYIILNAETIIINIFQQISKMLKNQEQRFDQIIAHLIRAINLFNQKCFDTNTYMESTSIHIPLHRILSILINSRFTFKDLYNQNLCQYLQKFFENQEKYQNFLQKCVNITTRVIGFIKQNLFQ